MPHDSQRENSHYRRQRFALLVLGALGVAGCSDTSELPRSEQTVDGMSVYLGVLPAELVRGHPTQPADPQAMHGGTPQGQSSQHVVVALFDARTATRITDARIRAGVGDRSYNHQPDTWLEPMQINGTISYGNFFRMQGSGVWRIHLQIYRPGRVKPTQVEFGYEPPVRN